MRYVRAVLVALLLLAPVAVVVAVARPSDGRASAGDASRDGSGPDGALVAGDEVRGEVGFGESTAFVVTGDGAVVVGVQGQQPFDPVMTVRHPDGEETEIDDTNGLDPQTSIHPEGEEVVVEVRGYDNAAGTFTVYVE